MLLIFSPDVETFCCDNVALKNVAESLFTNILEDSFSAREEQDCKSLSPIKFSPNWLIKHGGTFISPAGIPGYNLLVVKPL